MNEITISVRVQNIRPSTGTRILWHSKWMTKCFSLIWFLNFKLNLILWTNRLSWFLKQNKIGKRNSLLFHFVRLLRFVILFFMGGGFGSSFPNSWLHNMLCALLGNMKIRIYILLNYLQSLSNIKRSGVVSQKREITILCRSYIYRHIKMR